MSISSRIWTMGAITAATLAILSCGEPGQIITSAEPGVDPRSRIEIKDESEALGEAGVRTTAPEANTSVIPNRPLALPTAIGETKTTPAGVKYTTTKEGTGAVAKPGQSIIVHYVGTLDDGRKFDSTRDRDKTATFAIGVGAVIKGWDEAVPGMKIGEIRKLDVPPAAGYGAQGKGDAIPPNANLHFEIELVNIQ